MQTQCCEFSLRSGWVLSDDFCRKFDLWKEYIQYELSSHASNFGYSLIEGEVLAQGDVFTYGAHFVIE